MHLITCSDTIAQVKWSPDSEFVLCTLPKRGAVEVWSMENPAWKCKIEEGPAGVSDARFSPDSAYVLSMLLLVTCNNIE
jgi:WD40 repeat protein